MRPQPHVQCPIYNVVDAEVEFMEWPAPPSGVVGSPEFQEEEGYGEDICANN